jgi:DNA polymerase-3 subunit gamma/tau
VVLARKYRPLSFDTLIGQDAMVTTLRNAFKSGRIHHAFILTGVRGVGKTTTARILARAFNYEDETGRHPTLDFATEGIHDRAIIEGRHVDVMEMDAASNTGINDIREIIESVKYGPVSAPYKVYIIDEVHMLSQAAFNGLLKTLEEPPPYVKFIFATTEIRKVPVTILSRCMRFDLRRVTPEVMTAHLIDLLDKEAIAYDPEALAMIVRAGEGSVRDCQSLLDQAISYGDGRVTAETVKAMLGLGDRARTIDLFEHLMAGRAAEALGEFRALYDAGADPQTLIADLAEFTHLVTRIKIVPQAAEDVSLTPDERGRGAELAQRLGMRVLGRAWQILFRGYDEVARAGNALQAAEMVLVRLVYAADLPTPDDLIGRLMSQPGNGPGPAAAGPPSRPAMAPQARLAEVPRGQGAPQAMLQPAPAAAEPMPSPKSFAELIALAAARRDLIVKYALEGSLSPVSFAEGRIEVALIEGADPGILQTLSARLRAWTGKPWLVTMSTRPAEAPTLRQLAREREREEQAKALEDPLVKAIVDTFPGARVTVEQMLPADMPPTDPEDPGFIPDPDREEDDDE